MDDFLKQVDSVELLFVIIFSLPMALFYTLIVKLLFEFKSLPNWLFFVAFPALFLVVGMNKNEYVFVTLIGLFVGLAVLFIIGFFYRMAVEWLAAYRKRRKKESAFKIIKGTLLAILAMAFSMGLFFTLGRYAFIAIFLFIPFRKLFFPSPQSRFLRLQSNLPTSKIRSLAMGLVEIRGTTKIIEPLISRLGKKECIGYRYTIEKVHSHSDGPDGYSLVFEEVVCQPFMIEDETGEVRIEPEGIDLLWLELTEQNKSGSKRYSQYRLMANQNVLLVGKASHNKQQNIIEREPIKNIFTLAPMERLSHWNRNKPLYQSAINYALLVMAFVALILIATVEVKQDSIQLTLPSLNESLEGFSLKQLIEKAYE